MGDRRVVVLEFPAPEYTADIAIYTHWGGASLAEDAQAITDSAPFRNRIGDETYAARIFIDQLTADARDEETGFGVYPIVKGENPEAHADGGYYPVVRVNLTTGKVR